MKEPNFPERKRQRQITALRLRKPVSAKGNSNAVEIAVLTAAVAAGSQRGVRTKKDRSARGRFRRAAA